MRSAMTHVGKTRAANALQQPIAFTLPDSSWLLLNFNISVGLGHRLVCQLRAVQLSSNALFDSRDFLADGRGRQLLLLLLPLQIQQLLTGIALLFARVSCSRSLKISVTICLMKAELNFL